MKKVFCLFLCVISLCGCTLDFNNFSKFEGKLGVKMPTKYKRVFDNNYITRDSQLIYDIYEIKDDWKLEYNVQFQTDFEEDFDLDEYIDSINGYNPLNISTNYYIPHSSSLDWVCKREVGSTRNYEWLLIYDSEAHILYALDSTHQWAHQAIPTNNY